MREVAAWGDEVFAFNAVLHVSDDGRDFGEESFGLAEVGFWGVVLAVGIEVSEDGDGGAEDVHRDGVLVVDEFAGVLEILLDHLGEFTLFDEFGFELGELGRGWFFTDEEEVGDFFEAGVCGEVCDFVAAVDE